MKRLLILALMAAGGCGVTIDTLPTPDAPSSGQPNPEVAQSPQPPDNCPGNPDKDSPGVCGCAVADTDSDQDGTPNCIDQCPDDSLKNSPGVCGCGADDLDLDLDGFIDLCLDNCPFTFNPDQLDSDLDGTGDVCDETPFPAFVSGNIFSFLTPDETQLFLLIVADLNAEIDRLVTLDLNTTLADLSRRGFFGSSLACNARRSASRTRVELKREGSAPSAIEAAATFGIQLTVGLFEWAEIDTFNLETYPDSTFSCAG